MAPPFIKGSDDQLSLQKIACHHPEEVCITIQLAKGESYRLSGVQDLYMIELSLLINKTILSLEYST